MPLTHRIADQLAQHEHDAVTRDQLRAAFPTVKRKTIRTALAQLEARRLIARRSSTIVVVDRIGLRRWAADAGDQVDDDVDAQRADDRHAPDDATADPVLAGERDSEDPAPPSVSLSPTAAHSLASRYRCASCDGPIRYRPGTCDAGECDVCRAVVDRRRRVGRLRARADRLAAAGQRGQAGQLRREASMLARRGAHR